MATVTEEEPILEVGAEFRSYHMNIGQYREMVEDGILGPSDPVFLWQGRLVETMTKGRDHVYASAALISVLPRIVPDGWHIRAESPVALIDDSVPEPDFCIVRGPFTDYRGRYLSAADVPLLVEISDSSLAADRGTKLRGYGAAGIPIYWIVNVVGRQVEVYSDPTGPSDAPGYRSRREFGPDEEIPIVLDGLEVGRLAVKVLFP